jgi:hypothetical protein
MSKHDEVRQILYESGFKFKDSNRTALDMTDAEVEAFLIRFVASMTELGRAMSAVFQSLAVSIARMVEPLQDLGHMLDTTKEEET